MKDLEEKIVEYLETVPEGVSSRGLLKKMKPDDRKDFYSTLEKLSRDGVVSVSKKHSVRLKKKKARIAATIVSLSRGFAFARPEDGGEDIFIHADRLHGAFLGDKVLLHHLRQSPKGLSAEVDAISQQNSRTITGTFRMERGVCELIPDDAIRYPISLGKKSTAKVRNGDKVQARVRLIPHSSSMEAEIVKVYGKSDSAKICADAILDQNRIRTQFPADVLEEARQAAARIITDEDRKGRLDLRETSVCTIDGADAKDLDDAISVSKTPGGFRLGVHIADVSHYVEEGGALDQEARERGTSVYFADRVVPMLPQELSNGVCSLTAGQDKLTFSAIIELDREGNLLSYRFRKSVINSKVRGVYSEVNRLFDGTADAALRQKYHPVIRSLHAARELAAILKQKSVRNGAFDLESTESEFSLDENGICVDVKPRRSGEAEQMIEQLMITANQAAAKLARSKAIPFVYRVHEQPNPERVKTLIQLIDALGLNSRCLKREGDLSSADFAEIMKQAEGTPISKIVSHQILRTMAKARYDENPIGHFGLALADYCHFTSPIRRYPDTAIHRILSALLKEKDPSKLERFRPFASSASKSSSEAEIRAMTAERSAEDCYMAEYMKQHIGETYDGVVSGVTQRGVFVELESSVEGFVPMDSFEGCNFQFDGMITQVDANSGKRLTIGQPLRITVVASDVTSGKIDFVYAGKE